MTTVQAQRRSRSAAQAPRCRQRHGYQLPELVLTVIALLIAITGLAVRTRWLHWTLVALALALAVGCVLLAAGHWRRSRLLRMLTRLSEILVELIKRPIALAVLDEIHDVVQRGDYAVAMSGDLARTRAELENTVRRKLKSDPRLQRFSAIPFSDQLIELVGETALSVVMETVADPCTEELLERVATAVIQEVRTSIQQRAIT
jgi:hypothetical protein